MNIRTISYWKWVIAAAVTVLPGCGSESNIPFEQFERLPRINEKLSMVPIGEYVIPVPGEYSVEADLQKRHKMVQFEFRLHAAVLPKYEQAVTNNYEDHQGRIQDAVIRVVRSTKVDDLLDPALVTLKGHLGDSIQPYLSDSVVERLHIEDPQIKPL